MLRTFEVIYKDLNDMYKNCVFKYTRGFMSGSRGLWVYRIHLLKTS